jgi:hypothetical protein
LERKSGKEQAAGPAPKALLVTINHVDPVLDVEMIFTKVDATEDKLLFRGLTTGEEVVNFLRGIPVRSRATWISAELLIESWMSLGGRESYFRDYWFLSSDGQALTMEHRNDALAGQVTLLEKIN